MRAASLLRSPATLAAVVLFATSALHGCGARSTIEGDFGDDLTADASTDGAPSDGGCHPGNCVGCCDSSGNCRVGMESSACGRAGIDCVNCAASGEACDGISRQCGPAVVCNASNCPSGCCDPWGACRQGTGADACGAGGAACVDCSSAGYKCNASSRQCESTVKECGFWNCYGCCTQGDECAEGNAAHACGQSGTACNDCTQVNGWCDPGTGTCVGEADCGPWNCEGCCEGGVCQMGTSSWSCGSGGNACTSCSSPYETCDALPWGGGECVGVPPPDCGPWNCAGCCINGYPPSCVAGTEPWACGYSGQVCSSCSPGQTCDSTPWGGGTCGSMVDAGPSCGAWNCKGCCTSTGLCLDGTQSNSCGSGGASCQSCGGTECIALPVGGGTCGSATCGAWNCKGCCASDKCLNGLAAGWCGSGGNACVSCPSGICYEAPDGGGTCGSVVDAGPACGPWNCNGCCDPTGVCRPGIGNFACGVAGMACENCSVQNLVCSGGSCQPSASCGPATCSGCCAGGVCRPGTSDMRCGQGGIACQNCSMSGTSCVNGACGGSPPPPQP